MTLNGTKVLVLAAAVTLTLAACSSSTDEPAAIAETTLSTPATPTTLSQPPPTTTVASEDTAGRDELDDVGGSTVAPTSTVPATVSTTSCNPESTTWEITGHPVIVRIPDTSAPVPVIVALHGYKGTPEGLEYYSELDAAADAGEAIVAYPAGTPLDLGFGWNSGSTRFATETGDDVGLLVAVVDQLLTLPCADADNVTLAGESNGGGMTVRAACDPRMAPRLDLIALVNPAIDEGVLANCGAVESPTAVLAVAGRADPIVPFDGSREPFIAVDDWFPRVAQSVAGCTTTTVERTEQTPMVEVVIPSGCGTCAVLLAVADGEHTWPGSFEGSNGMHPGTVPFTDRLLETVHGDKDTCETTPHVVPIANAAAAGWGTTHAGYPASDVFAPCGADVVSPVDGALLEVRRVDGWDAAVDNPATRGGRSIAVLGDDGVRYYLAHFDTIVDGLEPGVVVEAGQVIGTVGTTGRSSACHAHFAISPPCPGKEWSVRRGVIWPYPYLDDWRAGGQRSPVEEIDAWLDANPDACTLAMADPFAGDA